MRARGRDRPRRCEAGGRVGLGWPGPRRPLATSLRGATCVYFLPRIRFAIALIFANAESLSLPTLCCCEARAFAFAAWSLSGIGYERLPGNPNFFFGSFLRAFAVSSAMAHQP